jgi:hypothetical protein
VRWSLGAAGRVPRLAQRRVMVVFWPTRPLILSLSKDRWARTRNSRAKGTGSVPTASMASRTPPTLRACTSSRITAERGRSTGTRLSTTLLRKRVPFAAPSTRLSAHKPVLRRAAVTRCHLGSCHAPGTRGASSVTHGAARPCRQAIPLHRRAPRGHPSARSRPGVQALGQLSGRPAPYGSRQPRAQIDRPARTLLTPVSRIAPHLVEPPSKT